MSDLKIADIRYDYDILQSSKNYFENNVTTINKKLIEEIYSSEILKMIKKRFFFYKMADKSNEENFSNQTLGEFLKSEKMSNYFIKFHIFS